MGELTGRIFNIQRFSVHDGPGMRDLIFFKGCPLRCAWCANPESQSIERQVAYQENSCIGCGSCLTQCPQGALSRRADGKIDRRITLCQGCGQCVEVCCACAMHMFGEDVTVEQLLKRVLNQQALWRASGGVTLSGGEVLLQAEFAQAFLKRLRAQGVHTAIETSAYAPWEVMGEVVRYCDLVFCDLKLADAQKHEQYTGVDNALIKANILKLSQSFPEMALIVRTPVVPGINDESQELWAITHFLQQVPNLQDYELLPYHRFGSGKYQQLGRAYALADVTPPGAAEIAALNNELRAALKLSMK